MAIRLRAEEVPAALDRDYKDLDFVVPKGRGRDADKLLSASGYQPDVSFNAMNGNERLLFLDPEHGRQSGRVRRARFGCATRSRSPNA